MYIYLILGGVKLMQNKWDVPEIAKVIKESKYPNETYNIFKFTIEELEKNHLNLTDLQLTVLANHVGEMVMRSKDNQPLDPIDESLFSGVSDEALNIAKDITNKIGNLASSEPFVLSIHFENAIENN